jgi:hypothetical protein
VVRSMDWPSVCSIGARRDRLRNLFLSAMCGIVLGIGSAQAEVVIKLRPPISIREHRTAAPSRRHVWIAGYHRWDGNAYVWERGHWVEPPRSHAVWVGPRYIHRRNGYVFVEGHWR